jgi:hypothetical protein
MIRCQHGFEGVNKAPHVGSFHEAAAKFESRKTAFPMSRSKTFNIQHSTFNAQSQTGGSRLSRFSASWRISAVAERRWRLARHLVPGFGVKIESVLAGRGKSGVPSGRMNRLERATRHCRVWLISGVAPRQTSSPASCGPDHRLEKCRCIRAGAPINF